MKSFKSLLVVVTTLVGVSILVSCKKEKKEEPYHMPVEWISGSWEADFDPCIVEIDSSYSIFSHATSLSFNSVVFNDELEVPTTNVLFQWGGCVAGSGGFYIYKAENDQFDYLLVPYDPALGLEGYKPVLEYGGSSDPLSSSYQIWNLTGSNFKWEDFVPGGNPDEEILDFTKIYIKKLSDTQMQIRVFFPNHYTQSFIYNRN